MAAPSLLPPLGFLQLVLFFPAMPGFLLFPPALCFLSLSPFFHLRLSHWICSASPLFASPTRFWSRSLFQYKCCSSSSVILCSYKHLYFNINAVPPPVWSVVIPSCCGTAWGCWEHRAGAWSQFLHLAPLGTTKGISALLLTAFSEYTEHPSMCGTSEWQWNPWR